MLKSYAYMRRIFEERSRDFSEFRPDCANIDATALNLLLKPWDFDVIVTDDGTVAITRAVLAEVAKA